MATDPRKTLCLFDVDGTLTKPRQVITDKMLTFLTGPLKEKCAIGLVGGSDEGKIAEQMKGQAEIDKLDYVFSENGLIGKKKGTEITRTTIQSHMGEEKLQKFINFALKCLSDITLPVKRGTFIEFRTGMLNVCPVGRSCSQEERNAFEEYDKQNKVREGLVKKFQEQFPDLGLSYVIGGQISIDVFPTGWDKTKCLEHLTEFEKIYFFGDKTSQGGNDYEIFSHERTEGHTVVGPEDTMKKLKDLFGL